MDRPWSVLVVYVTAVVLIVVVSGLTLITLRAWSPDVSDRDLAQSLSGLLAGSLASSAALLLTVALAERPVEPARLGLAPGRETGRTLAVMVLGILALGQTLDSAAQLAGFGEVGTVGIVRRALEGALGPELVAAILVIGVVAGAAEEVFFRGVMQRRLRFFWRPLPALVVTSAGFALLHVDPYHPHAIPFVLTFALSLYLGFVVEVARSTLPAVVCHVVNNVVFTLQVALGWSLLPPRLNAALALGGAVVFLGCVTWLRRASRAGA
jgi:membrane protease YdiL (CAAX protease family)